VQGVAVEDLGRREPVLEQLRGKLDVVACDARARDARVVTFELRPCSAWPNSWNSVSASFQLISTGSPGLPFTKLELFETMVFTSPSKRSWAR